MREHSRRERLDVVRHYVVASFGGGLHARAAEFGSKLAGATDIHASVHYERAGLRAQAYAAARAAADAAAAVTSRFESFELYRRAIANMPDDLPAGEAADVWAAYAMSGFSVDDVPAAEEATHQARRLYLQAGRAHAEPQPADGVTYAAKISKQDTVLDWRRPAVELERTVRAFRPAPGAMTTLDGEPLKIWRASVLDGEATPGSLAIEGGALVVGWALPWLGIAASRSAGATLDWLAACAVAAAWARAAVADRLPADQDDSQGARRTQ